MCYVKDTKDPNWIVILKTKPQEYEISKEAINEAYKENEEIDSTSFISNVFDKSLEFSLDRKDLTQSTTDGNLIMPMKFFENDNEVTMKILI